MSVSNSAEESQRQLVKSLTEIPLAEECYKPDLEVTDRYQTFSTEILRLSLLGIAALGFLFKEVVLNESFTGGREVFVQAKDWFGRGLISLGVSAALALAHRYVSSDCIGYQVRYLRLKKVRDERLSKKGDSEYAKTNSDMEKEKKHLRRRLKIGTATLLAAAVTLGLGVSLISVGLSKTIFSTRAMSAAPTGTNAVPAGR